VCALREIKARGDLSKLKIAECGDVGVQKWQVKKCTGYASLSYTMRETSEWLDMKIIRFQLDFNHFHVSRAWVSLINYYSATSNSINHRCLYLVGW
jgi:hypothetical protein